MGPVIEWGPPPGFALRNRTISSIGTPGLICPSEWDRVSMDTVSPDFIVSFGFSLMSYQPHCTFSVDAGSTKCLDAWLSSPKEAAETLNAAAPATRPVRNDLESPALVFMLVPRQYGFFFGAVVHPVLRTGW